MIGNVVVNLQCTWLSQALKEESQTAYDHLKEHELNLSFEIHLKALMSFQLVVASILVICLCFHSRRTYSSLFQTIVA